MLSKLALPAGSCQENGINSVLRNEAWQAEPKPECRELQGRCSGRWNLVQKRVVRTDPIPAWSMNLRPENEWRRSGIGWRRLRLPTRKLWLPDQPCIKRRSDGKADVQDERPP